MKALDSDTVMAANDAWIWMPDDAERVETDDYLLVLFPAYFASPTQMLRTHSERPPDELLAEVRALVADRGRSRVEWCVHDRTTPRGLEPALVGAGAALHEEVLVLARPLPEPGPADPGVEVRLVLDLGTLHDWYTVQIEAFGGERPGDEVLARDLRHEIDGVEAGTAMNAVAYVADVPVGAGGASVAGRFGRLWGGATVERARRRGVYRALLEARMRWAREHGADAALVKGRVDTSAPILQRSGFTAYGAERWYMLDT